MESPVQSATPANINPMPTPPTEPVADPVAAPVPPAEPQAPSEAPPAAPTPDAPPAPEPAPPVVYQPTGNKALDSAAKIVADKGFDPLALSTEMREHGGLTEATRAKLVDKFGEAQVDVLASTYSTEIVRATEAATAKVQVVYDTVGSKEMWGKIAEWTTTEAAGLSDDAANEYNSMLAAGGVQAQLAARALKEAYMASPGFKQDNPVIEQATGVPPVTSAIDPISRPQYNAERKKAVREGNASAVAQLDARARHTMTQTPDQWRLSAVIN